MLSWVKGVLGLKRTRKKQHSDGSLVSTFSGDREEQKWEDDDLNMHGRKQSHIANSTWHNLQSTLTTFPSSTSSTASSHHSLTQSPFQSTISGTPTAETRQISPKLARCSQPPMVSNTLLAPSSGMSFESLMDPLPSQFSSKPSTPEAKMCLASKQNLPMSGEDSSAEQSNNERESCLQVAAGDMLGLTINQSPYMSFFLTTVLTSQLGQLVTVQNERYVLVKAMEKVLTVSLSAGPCNMPPCRLVWQAEQPVPLVELQDSTFVEIDAVVSPESKKMYAAVIWQDTKPKRCLQLCDECYMFFSSRTIKCCRKSIDMLAKKLTVMFDGTKVSAEVCDAVVFIGLAKATLNELLQHNFEECVATVYKVLEGTGNGQILYVCTCLWVGQKPPTSSLPMVINRQKLYFKISHGLYSKSKKKVVLCLDVDASLNVVGGATTLEMELDGLPRSLKTTCPLDFEQGSQEMAKTVRVSAHVCKEKHSKNLVAFSSVMINFYDCTALGVIISEFPENHLLEAVPPCPMGSNDRVVHASKSDATAKQNSDEQQVWTSFSVNTNAPVKQKAPGTVAEKNTDTALQNTTAATTQKTSGTASQNTTDTASQKTSGTASQNTAGAASQKTTGAASQKTIGTASQKTTGTASQKTSGTASQNTADVASQNTGTASQKTTGTASQKTTGTASQKTTGAASQKTTDTASQNTPGTAAPKISRRRAKRKQKSASLSQLSCPGGMETKSLLYAEQQCDYLTCCVLVADPSVAVVIGAGKKVIVAKGDLFVHGVPLGINCNVASVVKKFPNLGVIFTQSHEMHNVHGHMVDLLAVVAWAGKKPSFTNDLVKQRLSVYELTASKVAIPPSAAPTGAPASLIFPKVTLASPTASDLIPSLPSSPKVKLFSPAAPKVTPASPTVPKLTPASPTAPSVTTPAAPVAANIVDATCMVMKISQETVTLIVRSKSLPGNCGIAHARRCDIFENGIPLTHANEDSIRGRVLHCCLHIKNDGKQLEVPLAWCGRKPVFNSTQLVRKASQQPSHDPSTGDLTSSSSCSLGTIAFKQDDCQTPPSVHQKVMMGMVTKVQAEGGCLRGEDCRDYPFLLEVCSLFGICLYQIKKHQVLVVGMMVEFEVAEWTDSSSSSNTEEIKAVVQQVWVGGKDASLAFTSPESLLDSWCSDNHISSATQEALMKEAELLSPSLFPTASKFEATPTVDISV